MSGTNGNNHSNEPIMSTGEDNKLTVLITGCSDGGLGAALALAFHEAGFHVYATARDVTKMGELRAAAGPGIETLPLDVQSASSIEACVSRIKRLDILVNNAGTMMTMPLADVSIPQAKGIFDTNVWGVLAVTQAFLPLLLESARRQSGGGIIAVNTSVASVVAAPFLGVYSASKAAMAMFCDTLRLELAVFGLHVVELKTGAVGPTKLPAGRPDYQWRRRQGASGSGSSSAPPILPDKSIYAPAREVVEGLLRRGYDGTWMPPAQWAKQVVQDLVQKKTAPPSRIWRGQSALLGWAVQFLPSFLVTGPVKRQTKYTQVEEVLRIAHIYPGNDVE
ncbi:short-chain dehydrogenase [Apiospora hydei]|uniref:Short-chain dehydrogenase n=1 Tax=Apiospora hydei TaxID=1337664 RepID=A0ABR1VLW7_9PEZI